jgi:hypothetical protein
MAINDLTSAIIEKRETVQWAHSRRRFSRLNMDLETLSARCAILEAWFRPTTSITKLTPHPGPASVRATAPASIR